MNLIQKQKLFSKLISELILKAIELGYEITLGEAWRPDETAKLYKERGIGIDNSLHRIRLAFDLNVFKDDKLLTKTEDYREVGELWESMSGEGFECAWGGRFSKGDGNHFSISHLNVK